MSERNIVVGLDLGSHRVRLLVAQVDEQGRQKVLGLGTAPGEGIRKGLVVDFDTAVAAISQAREEAEASSGLEIRSAFVGVGGQHFRVIRSEGVHVKDGPSREISAEDVRQVVRVARGLQLPAGLRILHTLPVDFILDNRSGIEDPVGMDGVRLQSQVLLVLGDESILENSAKAVRKAGLEVEGLVFRPLATAMAALTRDEKDSGTVLLDIGEGCTEILVLHGGSLAHAEVLPLGGGNVTRDLSIALSISLSDAERLKMDFGAALSKMDEDMAFPITQLGASEGRHVTARTLRGIVDPRLKEILELAWDRAQKTEVARRPSTGVVLCGGASLMPGLSSLAAELFDRGVRLGEPVNREGLLAELQDPRYTPLVGLLSYGFQRLHEDALEGGKGRRSGGAVGRILKAFGRG
ncbi:cell division protein FtsA [bacterium]|nr:cell division protein FtsA [bacterium]